MTAPNLSPSPPEPTVLHHRSEPTLTAPAPEKSESLLVRSINENLRNQSKRRDLESRMEESRLYCDPSIRAFAECAKGRTFSTVWACKEANTAMHECMQLYMQEHDKPVLPPSPATSTTATTKH